jgi:cellulose synthase/poly-beta-1,6-N-acetylglucosamine synthase-like glycosyltransferase
VSQVARPLVRAEVPAEALPRVTAIVPCRNECPFIAGCLTSIVENGYPAHLLQLLVVDGMSTDGTRAVIRDLAEQHPGIELLDNPRGITPAALNIGIHAARGGYVLWMSAHNRYSPGYIEECVRWALGTAAENVGGVMVTEPRGEGLLADAIVSALTHRFGVGNSAFRLPGRVPRWVDTVFGGCYRRDVFDRIGTFNEALVRGQDMEFNLRLARAGGRTLLVPSARSTYYARTRLGEFLRHNWLNGAWAVLPFRHSRIVPVAPRHLAPLAFALTFLASVATALFIPEARWLPLALLLPYFAAAGAAAAQVASRRRDARLLFAMPVVLVLLHGSYGFGSLCGLARSALPLLGRALGLAPVPGQGERPTG